MIHPHNRMERKRSAEAKALKLFKPQRIDGKKRKKLVELEDKETKDELTHFVDVGEYS